MKKIFNSHNLILKILFILVFSVSFFFSVNVSVVNAQLAGGIPTESDQAPGEDFDIFGIPAEGGVGVGPGGEIIGAGTIGNDNANVQVGNDGADFNIGIPGVGGFTISVDSSGNISTGWGLGGAWQPNRCKLCTATQLNQIAAAWATEGYYQQANIIQRLGYSKFQLWAPLIYIVAAIGAIFIFAMGERPKLYLWFLIGPALFKFLVFTTVERKGVQWQVAGVPQDQSVVWRLAEVGLNNTPIRTYPLGELIGVEEVNNIIVNLPRRIGEWSFGGYDEPIIPAQVSFVFAKIDDLFSSTADVLAKWTGIFSQWGGGGVKSNIAQLPPDIDALNNSWFLLSNNKWPMLENITATSLHNPNIRELLTEFMSSECGDILYDNISYGSYLQAANAGSSSVKIPPSVFPTDVPSRSKIKIALRRQTIPAPQSLKALYEDTTTGSLMTFDKTTNKLRNVRVSSTGALLSQQIRSISCDDLLWIIVQGFRWEAGHIFSQLVSVNHRPPVKAKTVVYDFLYGWNIKTSAGKNLTSDEQIKYIQNLILVHLLKNELSVSFSHIKPRFSTSAKTIGYGEEFQRRTGSKQKFSEFYSWAKLMPYIQGVLLYLLIMAYPFVCIAIVVPGWWKALMTWMGFFAWAKSWDVGFALVTAMERSIWATIGNSEDASILNTHIIKMDEIGSVKVECPSGAAGDLTTCLVPVVETVNSQTVDEAFTTFDKGFTLAGALDLDLQNSYYIYLMSALYFAVPVVTGQMLLGAKAGAASIAGSALSSQASEIGQKAGGGYVGELTQREKNRWGTAMQAAFGKSARKQGYALAALDQANKGLDSDLQSAFQGEKSQNLGRIAQNAEAVAAHTRSSNQLAVSGITAALDVMGGAGFDKWIGGTDASEAELKKQTRLQKGLIEQGRSNKNTGSIIAGGATGRGGAGGGSRFIAGSEGYIGGGQDSVGNLDDLDATTSQGQNRFVRGAWHARNNLVQFRHGISDHGAQKFSLATGYHSRVGQAGAGLEQFEAGMQSRGYSTMGQRYGQIADQAAREGAWRQMRDYSEQISGGLVAQGVFAGTYDPGPKPQSLDGMAGMGMLGGGASDAFWYTDQNKAGGFFGNIAGASGSLNRNWVSKVGSSYDPNKSHYLAHDRNAFRGEPNGHLSKLGKLSGQVAISGSTLVPGGETPQEAWKDVGSKQVDHGLK